MLKEFIRQILLEQSSIVNKMDPDLTPQEIKALDPSSRFGNFAVRPEDGFFFNFDNGVLEVGNRYGFVDSNLDAKGKSGKGILNPMGVVDLRNGLVGLGRWVGDDRSWSKTLGADKQKIAGLLRALCSFNAKINGFELYAGHNENRLPMARDTNNYVGKVSELIASKEHNKLYSPGSTLTMYHGTSSATLEGILRQGLRPHSDTGVKQWDESGSIYGDRAIYLTTEKSRAMEYAENACDNNALAEPVILKVEVPVDDRVMRADDDWLQSKGEKSATSKLVSDWQTSLKETGQIAYLGRIPGNRISIAYPDKSVDELRTRMNERKSKYILPDNWYETGYYGLIKMMIDADIEIETIIDFIEPLKEETYFREDSWGTIKRFTSGTNHDSDAFANAYEAALEIADTMDEVARRTIEDSTLSEYGDSYEEAVRNLMEDHGFNSLEELEESGVGDDLAYIEQSKTYRKDFNIALRKVYAMI